MTSTPTTSDGPAVEPPGDAPHDEALLEERLAHLRVGGALDSPGLALSDGGAAAYRTPGIPRPLNALRVLLSAARAGGPHVGRPQTDGTPSLHA